MESIEDRRVNRTRNALLTAFRDVVFADGYTKVTVQGIVARADVGRSTFYEHFTGKDDILCASMAHFFEVLAQSVSSDSPPPALSAVLDHLWSNRRLTDAIFSGVPRAILARALAQMIEERIEAIPRDGRSLLPTRLAAIHLAEAQLALIEAWLRGKTHCALAPMTEAFHASSRAAARACLFGSGEALGSFRPN